MYTMCVCLYSLFKDVLCVHPSVELGQFDGEEDTGDQEDTAASQTKPECVLKNMFTSDISHFFSKLTFLSRSIKKNLSKKLKLELELN